MEEKQKEKIPENETSTWCFLFVVLGIVVTICFAHAFFTFIDDNTELNHTHIIKSTNATISSLYSAPVSSGEFVLGTGSVESTPHFFFYVSDVAKNKHNLKWIPADITDVITDENETPYVSVMEPMHIACTRKSCVTRHDYFLGYLVRYELHVPVGTIKERYDL